MNRKKVDSFYQIPRKIHRSADFRFLSGNAVKLLVSLAYQFNGINNGDLTTAWRVMHEQHGFRSPNTVDRARHDLMNAKLIEMTRQGGLGKCSLYALTWLKRNPCNGKMDVQPTSVPTRSIWNQEIRTVKSTGSVVVKIGNFG
jgi:hypothetical protein